MCLSTLKLLYQVRQFGSKRPFAELGGRLGRPVNFSLIGLLCTDQANHHRSAIRLPSSIHMFPIVPEFASLVDAAST